VRPGGGKVGTKDKISKKKEKVVESFEEPKPAPKK
jgi:hypothetical protein